MAALVASALGFASRDLRCQGFTGNDSYEQKLAYCVRQLDLRDEGLAWAVAEKFDIMARLRHRLANYCSRDTLFITLNYGQEMARGAARTLQTPEPNINQATKIIREIRSDAGRRSLDIQIDIADDEVLTRSASSDVVDQNRVVDHIRNLTAEVLNIIQERRRGPTCRIWGDALGGYPSRSDGRAMIPGHRSVIDVA
jgi:hypothetical protein